MKPIPILLFALCAILPSCVGFTGKDDPFINSQLGAHAAINEQQHAMTAVMPHPTPVVDLAGLKAINAGGAR
jgi:hypothetical protein